MRDSDYEPVGIGRAHREEDGDVVVMRGPDGDPLFVPRAYGRLSEESRDMLTEVQHIAAKISEYQAQLDRAVMAARDSGVSWDLLGWSVGMTANGARQRWVGQQ